MPETSPTLLNPTAEYLAPELKLMRDNTQMPETSPTLLNPTAEYLAPELKLMRNNTPDKCQRLHQLF